EDMRLFGAVIFIDGDASSRVRLQATGGKIQFIDVALAAHRVEQRLAGNFFLALQIGDDQMIGSFLDAFDLFVEAQSDAAVPQMVAKRLDHFRVGELQQARALLDQRHAHAERREHADVLDADHSATHNDHGLGNLRHLQNLIAIDDGLVVERDQRRDGRLRASGDNDVTRFKLGLSPGTRHLHVVRIEKAGGSRDDVDAVAGKLRANHIDFRFDDAQRAKGKIRHGDLFLDAIVDAIDALILIPGKVQDRFADGFAGNGAGVDGSSADHFQLFDERGAFSEL